MSFCKACFTGTRWEGEPEGVLEKIGGIECYVATPTVNYPKDKVVLILSDAFGLSLVNNKLLADDFARNGFKTIMPDLFNGEPLPENSREILGFDREAWFAKNNREALREIVDAVVDALKERGVTRFATTAYCYGAPPALHLACARKSHVTALAHPSRLHIPADLERYRDLATAPLLINNCERDPAFPKEAQEAADEIFGGGKFAPGYATTYWEDCDHGYAVRGDITNPKVKAAKEGAFKATVEFFIKHL